MLLYLFHILHVSGGDAQVHWNISEYILRGGKKREREARLKKRRKKNTMIWSAEKNDRVKEWRWKRRDKGTKVVERARMGCHSPSRCRFCREDRGICRRQPLKRLSSPSTVSCHSPFLQGRCIASKFTLKIRHPLTDVTDENLIAKISNTYISNRILFFKRLYALLCF